MDMTVPMPVGEKYSLTDVSYFDPEDTLITVIRRAIANKQNIRIKPQGEGELLILGEQGEYFSSFNDDASFFASTPGRCTILLLAPDVLTVPGFEQPGRDLDELLWKAAFYSSQGRLMKGCDPLDMVELSYWPNLTRLPHTVNAPHIAALLSRHTTTICFVARCLKITREEVFQFYSAAYCAGMARPVNRTTLEPELEPHRHRTLLTSLWKKIASL